MEDIQKQKTKRWFKEWWGILIIVFSVLILLLIINFIILTLQFKKSIELGEIIIPNVIGQYSEFENGINLMDKSLNIKWPRKKFSISKKDSILPSFKEFIKIYKFL